MSQRHMTLSIRTFCGPPCNKEVFGRMGDMDQEMHHISFLISAGERAPKGGLDLTAT